MDLVFNNVYLLTAMAETDPSLEVFFKLLVASPLYNRYVNANPGVRACLYRLHDGWLLKTTKVEPRLCRDGVARQYMRDEYRHPRTLWLHRLSGPAVITTRNDTVIHTVYYINGGLFTRWAVSKRKMPQVDIEIKKTRTS